MNRVGIAIDMSHSSDCSTFAAIEQSSRPIAITHANPHWCHGALRHKSDDVLSALTASGGMLGFSLNSYNLVGGSGCPLESFCGMIEEAAGRYGADNLGIGRDLRQDQRDRVVEWMRVGRWSKVIDYGEGSAAYAGFRAMPPWFRDNRDFGNFRAGLLRTSPSEADVDGIMGGNWQRFYGESFGAA
jgi:membrane dipeptidase